MGKVKEMWEDAKDREWPTEEDYLRMQVDFSRHEIDEIAKHIHEKEWHHQFCGEPITLDDLVRIRERLLHILRALS